MDYKASIVADSISDAGHRLTTMEVTFPRIVLAEFNTHRVFSRNSASSRAIPVEKQIERVQQQPFIPEYWGAKQRGMQAEQELGRTAIAQARSRWLQARDDAVAHTEKLLDIGLHKQLTNRILEPFMSHTVIVTATEWDNFFALRANPMAQPEIRQAAELMRQQYNDSVPREVAAGEWHLPFIQADELNGVFEKSEQARQISAARSARVSYLTHEGKRDPGADLALYKRLVSSGHMSPLEHPATPFDADEWDVRHQLAAVMRAKGERLGWDDTEIKRRIAWVAFEGNFRGWVQLRKTIRNEHDFSLMDKDET